MTAEEVVEIAKRLASTYPGDYATGVGIGDDGWIIVVLERRRGAASRVPAKFEDVPVTVRFTGQARAL